MPLCAAAHPPPPPRARTKQLVLDAGPAALKFAVVDTGMVTFYSIMDLELPIYSDWQSVQPLPLSSGGGGSGKKRRRKSGKGVQHPRTGGPPSPLAAASSDSHSR